MITLHIYSWMIPTAITLIGLFWAFFIVDDGGGMLSGISNIMALVPVLFISMIAWIIWGIFK
jgi:hypothetical protein